MPKPDDLWMARVFFANPDEPDEIMHFLAITVDDAFGALRSWINTRHLDAEPIHQVTYKRVKLDDFGPLGERRKAMPTATYIAYQRPPEVDDDQPEPIGIDVEDTAEFNPKVEREFYEQR